MSSANPESEPDLTANARLGRTGMLMASGSMVSRVLGVVRNMLLGACVGGMTSASSAFIAANTLPNIIFTLLSSGVLTAVLIPQITRALKSGHEDAINALLTGCFGLILGITLLSTALAAPLVSLFGLRGPALLLGIAFAYLCLPQIFFYSAYAVWSQLLNVKGRFGLVMWTPALANLVQIAGMVAFLALYGFQPDATRWDSRMIWLLAGTSTLGIAIQALALLPAVHHLGFRYRPTTRLRGHGFRAASRVAGPMLIAVIFAQLCGVFSQIVISTVSDAARDAGHPVPNLTLYTFAFTIFMVPHGIVTVSILTALLPRMTRAAQDQNLDGVRADVRTGLTLPLLAMVPITGAAVALAWPGSRLLNPRLTEAEVTAVAWAFSLMALGLVPYAIVALQQRYNTAREDGRRYLYFQLSVSAIQLAFAGLAFALPPDIAVYTVSIGQTVSNGTAAVVFLWLVRRQLGGLGLRRLAGISAKLIPATLIAAVPTWFTVTFGTAAWGRTPGHAGALLLLGGIEFLILLLAGIRLFRLWEFVWLTGSAGRHLLPRPPANQPTTLGGA